MSVGKVIGAAVVIAACLGTRGAAASEGAASYYFAGGFGSFLTAVPPEPGFTAASQTLIFGGQAQRAVLRGRATFGLTAFAVYEYLAGSYAFAAAYSGRPPAGRRRRAGDRHGKHEHYAATPACSAAFRQRSDTGFGDMLLTPFAFYWSFGELNVKLSQWVVAPTGHYYVNSLINVGRNYWAFDTQLGITWFHKATGTELTVLPGIMLNTTQPGDRLQERQRVPSRLHGQPVPGAHLRPGRAGLLVQADRRRQRQRRGAGAFHGRIVRPRPRSCGHRSSCRAAAPSCSSGCTTSATATD